MASSTRRMGVSLEVSSKPVTPMQKFSAAIARKDVDGLLANYEVALHDMAAILIPTIIKRALKVVQEKSDKDKFLAFFQCLIKLTVDNIPQLNLEALHQGIAAYLKEFVNKESEFEIYNALIDALVKSSQNEVVAKEWTALKVKTDADVMKMSSDENESKSEESSQEHEATTAGRYWNLFGGGMEYLMQEAVRLKDWAIHVEDATDDWMLDSSPNNSPRPQ